MLLLCDHPDASDVLADRDLPDPCVFDREEMNKNEIIHVVPIGHGCAVVVFEPAVNGVLIEHRILNPPLHLVAHDGLATAGIHHHAYTRAHFFLAHGVLDGRQVRIGIEVHPTHAYTGIDLGSALIGMLQQHEIEFAPVHVPGVILSHTLIALLEADIRFVISHEPVEIVVVGASAMSRCPSCAEFFGES